MEDPGCFIVEAKRSLPGACILIGHDPVSDRRLLSLLEVEFAGCLPSSLSQRFLIIPFKHCLILDSIWIQLIDFDFLLRAVKLHVVSILDDADVSVRVRNVRVHVGSVHLRVATCRLHLLQSLVALLDVVDRLAAVLEVFIWVMAVISLVSGQFLSQKLRIIYFF